MIIHTNEGTVKVFINVYDGIKGVDEMGKVFLTLDLYMDKRGITRYALSEATDIRYDTINKYYRNRVVRYDSYVLSKICDALGCSIDEIVAYQPDM